MADVLASRLQHFYQATIIKRQVHVCYLALERLLLLFELDSIVPYTSTTARQLIHYSLHQDLQRLIQC